MSQELMLLLDTTLILILVVFIATTITSLILSRTTHFRQYYIYRKLRPNIERILGHDWKISKISWYAMSRMSKNKYKVYVEIKNRKIIDDRDWTNDFVIVDNKGCIIKEQLTNNVMTMTEYAKSTDSYNRTEQII